MAKKSKTQPDLLTAAAQTIGSTLGKLAVATGFERPAAKPIKAKVVKKNAAPKKATAKKKITVALTKLKSAVKKTTKRSVALKKTAPRKRA